MARLALRSRPEVDRQKAGARTGTPALRGPALAELGEQFERVTFRCSFVLDSSRTAVHGRLMPLEVSRTQSATGVTASQFRCRTALAG